MTSLCVITDYMSDDTTEEVSMLSAQDIEVFVAPSTSPSDWIDAAIEADAILTRHAPIERSTIEALKNCRIIARYGTGYDNIDADAALQANIVVTAVDSYATPEVADHRIRHHDRAIVTPHVAYYSTGSVIDAKHQSAGEIIRVLNGDEPLHPIRQTAV